MRHSLSMPMAHPHMKRNLNLFHLFTENAAGVAARPTFTLDFPIRQIFSLACRLAPKK